MRHGRVRHWSEWWHQYVELPLGDSDHGTYRRVMLLIGSLFRHLAPGDPHRVRVDEDRERYTHTAQSTGAGQGVALLAAHPATCDAAASLLGCDGTWEAADPGPPSSALAGRTGR